MQNTALGRTVIDGGQASVSWTGLAGGHALHMGYGLTPEAPTQTQAESQGEPPRGVIIAGNPKIPRSV